MKAAVPTGAARGHRSGSGKSVEDHQGRYTLHLIILALMVLTLISYRHVIHNGFVFDDDAYLVRNPHVQQGIGLGAVGWALTAFHGANWQPLTWLSSMLDYSLYGANPVGHHATNLVFHLANTVLLLLVLRQLTGSLWKSTFVAAVFALHPLHVESVAWASERKDVLSTFFMLLALWAYTRYVGSPSLKRYAHVAVALALGLMSKPMLVSLPILLLLIDYWPLNRLASRTALIREKAPLLALSLASCVITYLAQRSGGAVVQVEKFPLGLRAANSLVSYAEYIRMALWPTGLAAHYPYPREGVPVLSILLALLVLAAVSVLAIRQARSRPYLAVGWLWYVISLIPVIGLVQVGEQSMADRYMYIPLIGLSIMVAWGLPDLLPRTRHAAVGLAGVSALVVLAMVPATSAQVRYWESNYTLFGRVLSVTRGSALAHGNYGIELAGRGQFDGAIEHYRKAIEIDPNHVQSYVNLGNALKETGKIEEALKQYRKALEINPDFEDASVALAVVMGKQGRGDQAVREYNRILESNPDNAQVHYKLAMALVKQGKTDEAVDHLSQALDIDPKYAAAHHGLGLAFRAQGQTEQAAAHFEQAIRLKPDLAEAHNDLGAILAQQGRLDEAMEHFSSAVRYRPDYVEAHCNLALGLIGRNDTAGAIAEYRRAIEADPNRAQAHGGLAMAYYAAGRYAEAWAEVRIAESHGMKLPPDFIQALSSGMPPP